MATIPAAYLKTVSDAINSLSSNAQAVALSRLTRIIEESGSDNPFELVDQISDELESLFQALAESSASISATSYDLIRMASLGEGLGATPYADRDKEWTRKALYGIAKDHRNNMNAFVEGILQRMDYEAKRAAGSTQFKNGYRDPEKPRFARIPTGPETCPFCIMLASRGFVYWSEDTAGKLDHYHANCDCRIVPSYDSYEVITEAGATRRLSDTTIEGYDPDKYFDQYIDDLASGKLNTTATAKYAATKKVVKEFGSLKAAYDYAMGAKDMEDLQGRLNHVNELLGEGKLPGKSEEDRKRIYGEIIQRFRKRYRELLEESGVQYDHSTEQIAARLEAGEPITFNGRDPNDGLMRYEVAASKILEYELVHLDHDDKSNGWSVHFGITKDNAPELVRRIIEWSRDAAFKPAGETKYGQKFMQELEVPSDAGGLVMVRIVWIRDAGKMRMLTAMAIRKSQ